MFAKRLRIIAITGLYCLSFFNVKAQYTSDKVVGVKHQALADSLKAHEYPYLFPIWGKKVVAKGFNLPKSAGLSAQYLYQQSDIIIDNLEVGFNGGPMYPLKDVIRFNSAVATSNGINFRPDLWVFPFLNVYGILAQSKMSTAIDAGVWLPGGDNWTEVAQLKTKAEFKATTFGFGMTPTAGVGGFFFALDMNVTWSDIDALDDPAFVFIVGPRLGKNFSLKKPNQNIAVWVGGFRVKMATNTVGSLSATELFPIDQWEDKIDQGYQNLQTKQNNLDSWWNGLTPAEQKNPVNVAKYDVGNAALARYGGFLNGASQIVANAGDASIQYSLSKRPKDMWNFLIGSQFQLNKSWMLRVEYGFLSSRQQLIAGLQYRFDF